MISKLSLDINEVLRMSKNMVDNFCKNIGLSTIPVKLSDKPLVGTKEDPRAPYAVYNKFKPSITISNDVNQRLLRDNPTERVRKLNSTIRHELVHYEQYLEGRDFNEDEADEKGRKFALDALKKYTPEQINPVKSNPKHVKYYKDFHSMKDVRTRIIDYEHPKQPLVNLGELISVEYRPNFNSKNKGTVFGHIMGDTGKKLFKSNCILATDGKNFFILRKSKKVNRPRFNSQGIIG